MNVRGTRSAGAGTCTAPGQGEPGVFRWPGQWAGQGRTFTVHTVAPRPSRHGHLVLVAAGLTAFPTEPRRARAAACVQVTVAPLALAALGGRGGRGGISNWLRTLGVLATPRCPACLHSRLQPCSGSPQWPGAHSRHWGPPVPGRQWHCPLWGWHSELSAAGPQAHGRQPSQPSKPKCPSWGHRLQSTALSSPQNPPSFSPGAMRTRPYRPEPHSQTPPLLPSPAPTSRPRPSQAVLPDSGHSAAQSHRPCTGSVHCGGHRPPSRMGSSHTLQKVTLGNHPSFFPALGSPY